MACIIHPNYQKNKDVCHFIQNIDSLFTQQGHTIFNGRNTIKTFEVKVGDDTKTMVVKQFRNTSLFKKLLYSFFKKSKAEESYNHAIALHSKGIRTPFEYGFNEVKNGLFLSHSYVVMDFCDWAPIEAEVDCDYYNPTFVECFAGFVASLHQKGVLHHDLNATNVVYKRKENDASQFEFALIDINRMMMSDAPLSFRKRIGNTVRFNSNLLFYNAFIKAYLVHYNGVFNLDDMRKALIIKCKHDISHSKRKVWKVRLKHPFAH